jgi:hypothetical protein
MVLSLHRPCLAPAPLATGRRDKRFGTAQEGSALFSCSRRCPRLISSTPLRWTMICRRTWMGDWRMNFRSNSVAVTLHVDYLYQRLMCVISLVGHYSFVKKCWIYDPVMSAPLCTLLGSNFVTDYQEPERNSSKQLIRTEDRWPKF